jgi:hypothetical protein
MTVEASESFVPFVVWSLWLCGVGVARWWGEPEGSGANQRDQRGAGAASIETIRRTAIGSPT